MNKDYLIFIIGAIVISLICGIVSVLNDHSVEYAKAGLQECIVSTTGERGHQVWNKVWQRECGDKK